MFLSVKPRVSKAHLKKHFFNFLVFIIPKILSKVKRLSFSDFFGIVLNMETITKSFHFQKSSLAIPVTLEQIAAGLRGLSKAEFETLEILADREAAKILPESMRQASKGKIKKLSLQ